MSDALDSLADEATRDPNDPIYETTMHGRTWKFGPPNLRPAALRRYSALASRLGDTATMTGPEQVELLAIGEDMIRSALATPDDREAFDVAPFTGTEISAICESYFESLGAGVGESSASPTPSPSTVARSKPTTKTITASS